MTKDFSALSGDLHDDKNIVQFFQEVLTRRDEIDKANLQKAHHEQTNIT